MTGGWRGLWTMSKTQDMNSTQIAAPAAEYLSGTQVNLGPTLPLYNQLLNY